MKISAVRRNTINIKERVRLLDHMHQIILAMNNEYAYENWILIVPDEPDRDDFVSIAEDDEEFERVQNYFTHLIMNYGKDGWFVDF